MRITYVFAGSVVNRVWTFLVLMALFVGRASAEQIHVENLGVGVSVNSVVERPTWALIKEDGPVALYTAWVGAAAAVVAIETAADSDRIARFFVKVPGGGQGAAEVFQVMRNTWGVQHEPGTSNQLVRVVSCQDSPKEVLTHQLKMGGLYELLLTPSGSHPQGVLLATKERPRLSPALSASLAQLDEGALSAADPEWSRAYLLQKTMAADAREAALACKPNKPFQPTKAFTLGRRIAKQSHFVNTEGQWRYDGLYEAYELAFADGEAYVDNEGRLNEIRFVHNNLLLSDFNTMVDNAKMDMGSALKVEQVVTNAGNKTIYGWKTPAGSVELSLETPAQTPAVGHLQLRYYLHTDE